MKSTILLGGILLLLVLSFASLAAAQSVSGSSSHPTPGAVASPTAPKLGSLHPFEMQGVPHSILTTIPSRPVETPLAPPSGVPASSSILKSLGLVPTSGGSSAQPASTDDPQVLQQGGTIAQIDGNSALGFSTIVESVTLADGPSSDAFVYVLNGQTSTGDWYMAAIGYDLNKIGYYNTDLGCSSGFEMLVLITSNSGASSDAECLTTTLFTLAAGDPATIELNYSSAASTHMGVIFCESTTCGWIAFDQPNSGATGFTVMSSSTRGYYGGFTGPMTWLMDPVDGSCKTYPGLPRVDYDFATGVYVTQYIPWSQQWLSASESLCGTNATLGVQTLSPGSALTQYFDDTNGGTYGPHYAAGQNVSLQSALSGSYWWRYQTDVTPLTTPTLTASPSPADVGQAVTLTPSATGGVSPYSYPWYLNSSLQGTATGAWSWTPTGAATYSFYTYVLDSDYDYYGPSSTTNEVIYPDPQVGVPTASPPSGGVDAGGSVTFTSAVPTGGYGAFTYDWTSLPTGCANSGTSQDICSSLPSGTFSIAVKVTDATGFSVTSPSLSYKVDTAVTASLAISKSAIDLGQTVNLTVTPGGGSGTYTYAYSALPTGCVSSSVNPLPCTPTASGNWTSIAATVTDTNSGTATTSTVSLTVNAVMALKSFTALPSTVDVGGTTFLNATVTGGSGGYTYTYGALPAGCTSSSVASLTCVPNAAGHYNVTVKVTDTLGSSVSGVAALVVLNPLPPLKVTLSVNPTSTVEDSQVTFSAAATGGGGFYSYVYTGLPQGCTSSNASSLPCTPTQTGNFTVTVTVSDPQKAKATATTTLSVTPTPPGGLAISTFTATPDNITEGNSTVFNVVATGGTKPYSYTYSGLPTGCESVDAASWTCTPTAAGNFSVVVTVTDQASKTVQAGVTLEVRSTSGGTGPTISAVIADPNPVSVGAQTVITSTYSGGTAPLTWSYANLPPGCTSTNAEPLDCTANAPGNYTITVTVEDKKSLESTKTVVLHVTGTVQPLSVTLVANLSTVQIGNSVLLTANVNGGVGPYTYTWAINSTSGGYVNLSAASTSTYSPVMNHAGSYSFIVWVTDGQGKSVKSTSVSVSVPGSGGGNGSPASSSFPWWILLLIAAAVLGILGFIYVEKRRRDRMAAEAAMAGGQAMGPQTVEQGIFAPGMDAATMGGAVAMGAGGSMGAGSGDMGTGAPPSDIDLALAEAAGGGLGAGAAAGMAGGAPAAPLTTCPQCSGPLAGDGSCPLCGVSWVPDQMGQSMGGAPPPLSAPPPSAPLANCPQCGSPLGADQACQTCGVSWIPEAPPPQMSAESSPPPEETSPPDVHDYVASAQGELIPAASTPSVTVGAPEAPAEVPASSAATDALGELPPVAEVTTSVPPLASPEPSSTAGADSSAGVGIPPVAEPTPAAPPAEPSPEGPAGTSFPKTRVCFVCGTALAGDYCPTCDMSWEVKSL